MNHPSDSEAAPHPQDGLSVMRHLRRRRRARSAISPENGATGPRLADAAAGLIGSWRFIVVQSIVLLAWVILNTIGWIRAWDPYPFILMNLALSFQAAYAAPLILMSQNRQAETDRQNAAYDFEVDLKAEHEIKALHNKINLLQEQIERMRAQDLGELTKLVRELQARERPTDNQHDADARR